MNELHELWRAVFRIDPPNDQQWIIWESLHDRDIIREALVQLAVKHRKMAGEMTVDHMIRFGSAVMNRLSHERRTALAKLTAATVSVTHEALAPDDNIGNRA